MIAPADTGAGGGFFLPLFFESFPVRALVGSVVAATVAALLVHRDAVRDSHAQRLVVLAPVLVAAAAAAVTVAAGGGYLPQVWWTVPAAASGQVLSLLGELRIVSPDRGLDVLGAGWTLVATMLLSRRVAGHVRGRRLLRSA
nr:hypothetical protein [Euzebyales bacterium]